MNNRVINPNPFGSLTEQELEKFQKETGCSLPIDYADYLLKYNGGEFEKRIYDEMAGPYEDAVVHQMLGLHEGPEYARLQGKHELHIYYDLAPFRHILEHYFVFGTTSTGDLLMLDLRDSSVCHFQHDRMLTENASGLAAATQKISENFDMFVSVLINQREYEQKHSGTAEYEDFKRRLKALKQQAKEEADDFLKNTKK